MAESHQLFTKMPQAWLGYPKLV